MNHAITADMISEIEQNVARRFQSKARRRIRAHLASDKKMEKGTAIDVLNMWGIARRRHLDR